MPQFGFYNLWHRNAHAFQPHRNRLKKRKTVTKTVSHRCKLQRAGAGARPVRVELVENPFRVVRSNGIRGRSGFRRAEAFAGNTGSGYLVGSNVSFRRYRSAYFPAELSCSGRMLYRVVKRSHEHVPRPFTGTGLFYFKGKEQSHVQQS